MAYDNTNSGALFENDRKVSEKHTDIKGSINVDGVEYWCSGWNNTSAGGKNYIKLKLEKKEPKSQQAPQEQTNYDGNMPF